MLGDDDDDENGATEENRIIMEMYKKDNQDKYLRQTNIRTALTKLPAVPRAKDARSVTVD